MTLIEKLGVEFEERDGHLWVNFMQVAYSDRYRSLVRFGLLEEKVIMINEEAYELLCTMEEKLLLDSDVEKSFTEKYALRVHVRMLAEEIVMRGGECVSLIYKWRILCVQWNF